MTVVGLHPEELFDKLVEGELSALERERLYAHLEACEVCRFEYGARADFQAEALALGPTPPPAQLPLRAPVPPVVPVRRRSRLVVWGLAAAALITASGALASVVSGKPPWRAMSLLLSRPVQAPPAEAAVKPAPKRVTAPSESTTAQAPPQAALTEGEKPTPTSAAAPSAARLVAPRAVAAVPRHVERGASAGPAAPVVPSVPAAGTPIAASTVGPSAPTSLKEASVKEPVTASKLFADANQARRAGDLGRASGLYRVLQEQFAGSPEAELSRVTMALLLLDSGDAQSALTGFERYLAGSSRGLEAEALVGRARALGRLGRRDLEASAWQEVQRKYPQSIYGRQAGERLSALGQP